MHHSPIKTRATFALLLSVSITFLALPAQATPAPDSVVETSQQYARGAENVQTLPRNGGAPGKALRAYFAARKDRDWQAIKAHALPEVRRVMEETEADGVHLALLDRMADAAPQDIDILEAWIEEEVVAHVRYRGRIGTRSVNGHAELIQENGEWLVGVTGLDQKSGD